MRITNLLFWVQENKTSEKFYKKLGFEVVKTDDKHTVIQLGNFQIILVSMRDEEEFSKDSMTANKGRGIYVYLQVDSVDEKYQELIGLGLKPATKPRNWRWDNREFVLKDPDGYKLVFFERVKDK